MTGNAFLDKLLGAAEHLTALVEERDNLKIQINRCMAAADGVDPYPVNKGETGWCELYHKIRELRRKIQPTARAVPFMKLNEEEAQRFEELCNKVRHAGAACAPGLENVSQQNMIAESLHEMKRLVGLQ